MTVVERYRNIRKTIDSLNPSAKLLVVTKTKSPEILRELVQAGATHIAENQMQGLKEKHDWAVAQGFQFEYHLIAPIQSNKLKLLNFPFHYHCLTEIRHLEKMMEMKTPLKSCLIQVNISGDSAKSGVELENFEEFLGMASKLRKIDGVMTILKADLSENEIQKYYVELKKLADHFSLPEISMGMSSDFEVAARAGATMVRVGSMIVGDRV